MDAQWLGLVLCGGKSQRMGSDKGLLWHEGKLWSGRSVEKLSALDIPVKLSINVSQYYLYQRHFSAEDLVLDGHPVPGPLGGLLTVHRLFPNRNLFVLATDMLYLPTSLINKAFQYYQQYPSEALVYQYEGNDEPLCGIYSAQALAKIDRKYAHGMLSKISMKYILGLVHTTRLELSDKEYPLFANMNSPESLQSLRSNK